MSRPVVVDLTYVAARLHAATPTGIERVDAAFARHFGGAAGDTGHDGDAWAIHYGLLSPHLMLRRTARDLVTAAAAAWRPAGGWRDDAVYGAVSRWLAGPPCRLGAPRPDRETGVRLAQAIDRLRWRLTADRGARVPQGAIYLNLAQYAFEYPVVFRWLARRPDVVPVFFVHDLLPLDYPEFFREGYAALFERRVRTIARFARAAIVSSDSVGARLAAEMRRRGRDPLPMLSAKLPPPAEAGAEDADPQPGAAPYFLLIGTIEPRKNHLLVLQLWRDLAEAGGCVPRLVLVGPRGWENEQVVDLLDRSRALAPHVAEVSGLSTAGLGRLIRGARALLMPSFAEGYGLPIAEALAAGTPVIAADIPVFREVSQARALLLDPVDGPAWRRAVSELCAEASPHRQAALALAAGYVRPRWGDYFAEVEAFLATL